MDVKEFRFRKILPGPLELESLGEPASPPSRSATSSGRPSLPSRKPEPPKAAPPPVVPPRQHFKRGDKLTVQVADKTSREWILEDPAFAGGRIKVPWTKYVQTLDEGDRVKVKVQEVLDGKIIQVKFA